MIKILVRFLEPHTPYKAGDVCWITIEEYNRLSRQKRVEKFEEKEFFPLEGITRTMADYSANISQKPLPKKPKGEDLICPICGKKYKAKRWVKSHLKKVHKIG